jgi:uncharacterized protein YbjT (DUF2867 family)
MIPSNRFKKEILMILITGATGNVGKELTRQLLEAGEQVRIFTRDPRKVPALKGQVEIIAGDLDQPQTIQAALKGVEQIFLVTASTAQDANVLQAAKAGDTRLVVKLSTFEAVDPGMIKHVRWHHEREQLIRASGLAWTFLRPTMFMSTALDWAPSIRREGVLRFPGGEGKVPAVDPADVAAVAAVALTNSGHEGQAYALTGPEALNFGQMAEILSNVLGKSIRYVDIPEEQAGEMMRQDGLPDYVIEGLLGTFEVLRSGRLAATTGDVEKVTGRPARSFEAWCRKHVDAFQ